MAVKVGISKIINDRTAYFTVRWSALRKAERFDIVRHVPPMAGVFELYFVDRYKKLNLFYVSKSWHGGLRSALRILVDAELDPNPARRDIFENRVVYYRYSLSDSSADLDDVLFFYMATYFPKKNPVKPSPRFDLIYLNEESSDRIITT